MLENLANNVMVKSGHFLQSPAAIDFARFYVVWTIYSFIDSSSYMDATCTISQQNMIGNKLWITIHR